MSTNAESAKTPAAPHLTAFAKSATELNNDLADVKMERLGQVVALFGRNGAGKMRLLNAVRDHLRTGTPTLGQMLKPFVGTDPKSRSVDVPAMMRDLHVDQPTAERILKPLVLLMRDYNCH